MSGRLAVSALVLLLASGCGDDGASSGSARSFLHDSSWPVPTSDTWRSSTVSSGGLPADVQSEDLVAATVELGPVPFFAIIYSDDTLLVLGGTPFLLELFTLAQGNTPPDRNLSTLVDLVTGFIENELVDPYVAKIDTKTMMAQTLTLPRGDTPNYPGGIVAHANGWVYVIATATLYEIDPDSLAIRRSLDLPLDSTSPGSTVYNSLQVSTRNGDLVMKTGTHDSTGLLVRVDAKSLEIKAMAEGTLGTARMTTAMTGSTEYVYLPGPTETLRFVAADDAFDLDPAGSKTYRTTDDGTTGGVGMVNLGSANAVLFPNNNTVLYGVCLAHRRGGPVRERLGEREPPRFAGCGDRRGHRSTLHRRSELPRRLANRVHGVPGRRRHRLGRRAGSGGGRRHQAQPLSHHGGEGRGVLRRLGSGSRPRLRYEGFDEIAFESLDDIRGNRQGRPPSQVMSSVEWSRSRNQFDLARSPALVEEGRERTVEAQEREPALLGVGLDPVAAGDAVGLLGGEPDRRRAVAGRLGRG